MLLLIISTCIFSSLYRPTAFLGSGSESSYSFPNKCNNESSISFPNKCDESSISFIPNNCNESSLSFPNKCNESSTSFPNKSNVSFIPNSCDKSLAGKGDPFLARGLTSIKQYPVAPYTGEVFLNGTAEYFSNCSYTPEVDDETPSQRYVRAKTDCLNGNYYPNTLPEKEVVNVFCSPIAENRHPFYDQVARNTSLAIPPKCDPTYPNSPGSREFFMRMVNTWRNIAKLAPLKWNECLAENCNRATGGHEGFGSVKCYSGCNGLAEAAFGSACIWNWWRRMTIPMCAFFNDGHRGIFLNPRATKIGFYQTLRLPAIRTYSKTNCDFEYYLHVQSC